jgi:hypothetical protein
MIYSMHSSTEDPLYDPIVIKQDQQSWKRILIVDDNEDVTTTFKAGLEYSNITTNRKIKVYTCNRKKLVAYSLSKIAVTYQCLQFGVIPYQASILASLTASTLSIVLINFLIIRVIKLFKTQQV